jgi:hypothetical protein
MVWMDAEGGIMARICSSAAGSSSYKVFRIAASASAIRSVEHVLVRVRGAEEAGEVLELHVPAQSSSPVHRRLQEPVG